MSRKYHFEITNASPEGARAKIWNGAGPPIRTIIVKRESDRGGLESVDVMMKRLRGTAKIWISEHEQATRLAREHNAQVSNPRRGGSARDAL